MQTNEENTTSRQESHQLESNYSYVLKNYLGMTVVSKGSYISLAECQFDANEAFNVWREANSLEIYKGISLIHYAKK